MPKEELIKQRLADINNISIAIDTYDDIFSDFDPRDISERALSEDFIIELKQRYRENPSGKYEVVFFAPLEVKDENIEKKIVQRIKQYCHITNTQQLKIIKKVQMRGLAFVMAGMILLVFLTFLTYIKKFDFLTLELLGIMLMPLGWFGIWEGFTMIIEEPISLRRKVEVFKKLAKANYKFEYLGKEVKKEEKPPLPQKS